MKRLRYVIFGVVILAVTGTAGFYAAGGQAGLILLMVRLWMRTDYPQPIAVQWQAGPQEAASKAAPGAATDTTTDTTKAAANGANKNPRIGGPALNPALGEPADKSNGTQPGLSKRPPNIILIVADDLGINDITLHGGGIAGGTVPTPHINSIAQQGVDFKVGYSGNATCAPSRAALMTGRYATRFGFEFTPTPPQFMKVLGHFRRPDQIHEPMYFADREKDLIPYEDMGLPTSEITLARLLQGSGYHTVHLGKWHLGDSPQFRPYAHGFAESLSLLHAASMFLPENDAGVVNSKQDYDPIDRFLWAAHPWGIRFNDGKPFQPPKYLTDYLTDEAVKVVAANKNRPFFLYLAYNAPHTPLQATREDYDALPHIGDHTMRVYAAMIRSLDRNIGRVLQSLKDQGVDENTLVIFTSDNGGAHYIGIDGLNSPYRGWKATFFEGGIRVPYFMRWPAAIPKGVNYAAPVSHFDVYATAAAAAGTKVPADRTIDGVNLLPFIGGQAGSRPHDVLHWRTDSYRVIREGDWKLQVTELPKQDWLYNLAQDPTEKINLAQREPARVAAMKAKIVQFNQTQHKAIWPSMGAGAIPIDKTMKAKPESGDAHIYYSN